MGLIFLIRMIWPENILPFILMLCSLVISIKNIDQINIMRTWTSKITMFCSVVMWQTSNLSKLGGLDCLIDFIFSPRPFYYLGISFLYLGWFGLHYILTSWSWFLPAVLLGIAYCIIGCWIELCCVLWCGIEFSCAAFWSVTFCKTTQCIHVL